MPNWNHVIEKGYQDILRRAVDPSGLSVYQAALTGGLTEAAFRESLLRSQEYAVRFPTQAAPPPPPAGSVAPLRVVEGNRFGAAGQRLDLYGFVLCCGSDTPGVPDEAISRGWPAVIDDATLDELAANKINLVHTRLGPFSADGETAENIAYATSADGRVDLNGWNPAFWSRLRHFLQSALSRGIYVQLDLIDAWVLEHHLSPWQPHRNVQGFNGGDRGIMNAAPHAVALAWVAKCVLETRDFPNVCFQDGNEAWEYGSASRAWVRGLNDVIRQHTSDDPSNPAYRLYGTNTGRAGDGVDYLTFHQSEAHERESLPVMVNEYPTRSVDHVLGQIQLGRDMGTAFFYWPGGHIWPDRQRVFAGIKALAEGGSIMPDDCPWLVRMGAKVHNVMDGAHRQLDPPIPVVGGFVVFDLTPRFSRDRNDTRGRPCNAEHAEACQGRPCEDVRGGVWSQVGGPSVGFNVQEHGFQIKVGPIPSADTYTFSCKPPDGYVDQLGKAVRVAPQAQDDTCSFTVGVRA